MVDDCSREEALDYVLAYFDLHIDQLRVSEMEAAIEARQGFERHAKSGLSFGPNASAGVLLNELVSAEPGERPVDRYSRINGMVDAGLLQRCVSDKSCELMLLDSGRDSAAYEAACLVASELIAAGKPLPSNLSVFASKALFAAVAGANNGLRPPRRMGRPTRSARSRAMMICEMVDVIHSWGFPQMRNDVSEHRDSACDIVAEAMKALNLVACPLKSGPP